jgi:glc operon protein GlcG
MMSSKGILRQILFLTVVFLFSKINAQVIEKKAITLELVKKIAQAAELEALKNNFTMVISVVDDGGNLVYLERMDNSQIGSIEVAIQKARTAIYFKRPTKSYEEKVVGGNNAILKVPNVLPFEGGLPLIVDGQYIGAIGVSGGAPQQDGSVAQAGVNILSSK